MASGGAGTAEVVLLSGPLVRHTPVAGAGHLLAAGGRLRGGAGAVQVRRVYGIAFEIAFSPAQDTDTLFTSFCSYKCCCCSVMTDPQELWVGPQSQAAQEKAAYEVYPSDGLGHGRDAVKCIPAAPCSPTPTHPPTAGCLRAFLSHQPAHPRDHASCQCHLYCCLGSASHRHWYVAGREMCRL